MADKYQNKGFNKILNKKRAEKVMEYVSGDECLEIGCGEGQITKYLLSKFNSVTVIEPNLKDFKLKNKKLCTIQDELEFVEPTVMYDSIVCTNVLEHVDCPIIFLNDIKEWAHNDSIIFISVPNARSYNRLLGVDAGFIDIPEELTDQDIDAGHRRMYNIKTLVKDIEKAGFDVLESGTMIYKPLPNYLMNKLPNRIIKKCLDFPMEGNGAEIYVVCEKR